MSEQFLLPCECGESIKITRRDAGSKVQCSCGQSVDVPTLREITRLEPAVPVQTGDSIKQSNGKSPFEAYLGGFFVFVNGIAAIVLAIAVCFFGYFWYLRSQITVETTYEEELALVEQKLQSATPGQLWADTLSLQQAGLGERTPPLFHQVQTAAQVLDNYLFATGLVAVIALLILIVCGIAGLLVSKKMRTQKIT